MHALHPGSQLLVDPSAEQAVAAVGPHDWVHFCGHADPRLGDDRVLVWCKNGGLEAVMAGTLVDMLRGKQLVVLNGCCSDELGGALLRAGVRHVVCWETKLSYPAGVTFGEAFWRAMAGQQTDNEGQFRAAVHAAFKAGRTAVLSVTRLQASALDVGEGQRRAASVPKYALVDPNANDNSTGLHGVRMTPDGKIAAGVPLLLLCPRLTSGIPAMPDHYCPRPDAQRALREALLDNSRPALAITPATAISGTAGLGKTTIATWCANDPRVWSSFSDAVVWLVFGQERTALEMLRRLAENFGMVRADAVELRDEREAIDKMRTLLRDKHCLLVLDDIWDERQVAPFKQLCPPTGSTPSLLLTTRLHELGSMFGELQPLNPLVADDAVRVLMSYSCKSEAELRACGDVDELVKRCNGLPVMLRAVATMLKRRSVADVLRTLDAPNVFTEGGAHSASRHAASRADVPTDRAPQHLVGGALEAVGQAVRDPNFGVPASLPWEIRNKYDAGPAPARRECQNGASCALTWWNGREERLPHQESGPRPPALEAATALLHSKREQARMVRRRRNHELSKGQHATRWGADRAGSRCSGGRLGRGASRVAWRRSRRVGDRHPDADWEAGRGFRAAEPRRRRAGGEAARRSPSSTHRFR